MDCQWTALINVLPLWLRDSVNSSRSGDLLEIRLRIGYSPILIYKDKQVRLPRLICREDLEFCINTASRYSPWAHQTISKGFVTLTAGHRIGICGTVVVQEGNVINIREIRSLCIRVAKQFIGIGRGAADLPGNLLIIGPPGSGKSTLLRDLIRCKSEKGHVVCAIDERQELFPSIAGKPCFDSGFNTDVLSGCPKAEGVEIAIRLMNPQIIAVDEITAEKDCAALINAGWCGINLIATAHAASKSDFLNRPIYRPLVECKLFNTLLILQGDKSWRTERVRYDA